MNKLKISRMRHAEKGFTIVELMISLAIGLVLFAGVMSIFVGMRSTSAETSSYGELQENGRFAISVLTDDLLRQNFWGDLSGDLNQAILINTPVAPGNDCIGDGLNNATFPQGVGYFRTLWSDTIVAGSLNPLGCFTSPTNTQTRVGSDVLQLKRVVSNPVVAAAADNYYLIVNSSTGGLFTDDEANDAYAAANVMAAATNVAEITAAEDAASAAGVPLINSGRMWQYQHHVYYVRDRTVGGDTVPVLMQGRLSSGSMTFSPVIDGIEMVHFMFGIDTDTNPEAAGYGAVDAYIPTANMTDALWNNSGGGRILAVKMFVLAREVLPDASYTNTNTYQLGDLAVPVNDNFRRLLFSSTVTLYNNSEMSW